MRLVGDVGELLPGRFMRGEIGRGRGRGGGRDFQPVPFRHGEQAVEQLRLHGEILELQRTQLA